MLKLDEPGVFFTKLPGDILSCLLNGVYGVLLSPLTPKILVCDYGLHGRGENTDEMFLEMS